MGLQWRWVMILNRKIVIPILLVVSFTLLLAVAPKNKQSSLATPPPTYTDQPLAIAHMKVAAYPGSDFVFEQTLPDGANYKRYVVSYLSEGLRINGLLTVPKGTRPARGWPAIIFNHGYIPPEVYRTTERYVAYVDGFAKNGYVVFKADYRGNGSSKGVPEGAYYSPAYTVDVLNGLASVKRLPDVDINKMGMWGHSMGGNITLRSLEVDAPDIKAAVIWGGVVGSYDDLMNNWVRKVRYTPSPRELALRNNKRMDLINTFGTLESNPVFWQALDLTYHLDEINTPVQLHTGGSDEEVPVVWSQNLYGKLIALGKTVEYFNYPGGDHNISSPNFSLALTRSIEFFDKYLK